MRYLTARKRAEGKGAAHSGTTHHWSMTLSAVGLACMVPAWLYIFGSALGGTREEVLETFARPFPAILTGLVLVIGMRHFAMGAAGMILDYVHGTAGKALIIFVTLLAWAIGAVGIFALLKIAL